MTRLLSVAAAVALLTTLPACDFNFSEGGDFQCRDGATASGTIGGLAFAADCVEVGEGDGGLSIGAYRDYNYGDGDTDPVAGQDFASLRFRVGGNTVGTYTITSTATSETYLDYFYSPGDDITGRSTDVSINATSGQVQLTSVTADRIAGTVTFSGPEFVGDNGGTATGETLTGSITFSVPR